MADWQGELDALLARLSVAPGGAGDVATGEEISDGVSETIRAPWLANEPEDDPLWAMTFAAPEETRGENVEVSAVRSEIEATLRQIGALVRSGRIEASLRDDVVFVLSALTRPRPIEPSASAETRDGAQEWQLASAAAVLRFCRIVFLLTRTVARHTPT